MSAEKHDVAPGFWMAVVKTIVFALVFIGIPWVASLIYLGMADTAGAGWDGYTTRKHVYKMDVPGLYWWILALFINSKAKSTGKLWIISMAFLLFDGFWLGWWMFTDIPLGSAGTFWFREVLGGYGTTFFPDVHVPPRVLPSG